MRNICNEFQCFDFWHSKWFDIAFRFGLKFSIVFFLNVYVFGIHNTIVHWRKKENKINTRNVMCFIVLTQTQYSTSITFKQHTFHTHTKRKFYSERTYTCIQACVSMKSLSQHSMSGKIQTQTHTHTESNPSVNNSCSNVELNCLYTLAFYIPFVKLPAKAIILACQTRWLYVTVTYSRTVRSVARFVRLQRWVFWKPL